MTVRVLLLLEVKLDFEITNEAQARRWSRCGTDPADADGNMDDGTGPAAATDSEDEVYKSINMVNAPVVVPFLPRDSERGDLFFLVALSL